VSVLVSVGEIVGVEVMVAVSVVVAVLVAVAVAVWVLVVVAVGVEVAGQLFTAPNEGVIDAVKLPVPFGQRAMLSSSPTSPLK